jgi:CheY-like chemotaxis protein
MKELPLDWNFFPTTRFIEGYLVPKLARHVFVVDDEVLITKSLSLILSYEGFRVSSFNNPLEALERMKTTAPDVLISDVMMPQLSGVDLAIHTTESRPECKILLFSASTGDILQNARARGHHFRLLRKPVHPTELLQEIHQLKEDGTDSDQLRRLSRRDQSLGSGF